MMKKDRPKRQVCKPKDYAEVTGKSVNACRSDFRKWKLEEGLSFKQYLVFELVCKKSGIPYQNFVNALNL